jgi:hypothetical protein
MSYQDILDLAQDVIKGGKGEPQVWVELTEWVNRKIAPTFNSRKNTRKGLEPLTATTTKPVTIGS